VTCFVCHALFCPALPCVFDDWSSFHHFSSLHDMNSLELFGTADQASLPIYQRAKAEG
jgi:hypothetical protein